jgi:hypothetical protein
VHDAPDVHMLDVQDFDLFGGAQDQAMHQYKTLLSNRCCNEDGIPHMLQNAASDDGLVSATFALPGFTVGSDGNAKLAHRELWHMPGFAAGQDGQPIYFCSCTPKELGVKRRLALFYSVMSHDEEAALAITSGDCPHIRGLEALIQGSKYNGDFDKILSAALPLPEGKCNHFCIGHSWVL